MVRLWVIVGGLLLVLVGTAFLAPTLIDLERYRDRFEAEASALLGREVRVGGIAGASLVPFPSITFEDVVVEGVGGEPSVTVDRFSFDAELAPFLRGEILVFDARLDAPTIDVVLDADGRLRWTPGGSVDPGAVTIERLTVSDGTLHVTDGEGRLFEASDVDLVLGADTLLGPWRAAGAFTAAEGRYAVEATTGLYEPELREGVRLNLTLATDALPAPVNAFGTATLRDGTLAWEGEFGAEGGEGEGDEDGGRPFVLAGTFEAGPAALIVPQYRLAIGTREDPYVVNGEGALRGGEAGGFTFLARGQRLDAARLGDGGGEDDGARFATLARLVSSVPAPGVDGVVDVALPAVVLGDTTVRDVRLRAAAEGGDWRVETLALALPGRTELRASGRLAADGSGTFDGRFSVLSRQPTGIATWLGHPVEDALRPLDRLGLEARLSGGDGVQRLDDVTLTLGDERLTGAASVTRGEAATTLTAALDADTLDADAARAALVALTGGDVDLGPDGTFGLGALEVDLTLSAGTARYAGIEAEGVAGRAVLGGDRLALDGVRGTVRGAALTLDGTLARAPTGPGDADAAGGEGGEGGTLVLRVVADEPSAALALLSERSGAPWAGALAERADELAPLDAAIDIAWLDPAAIGFDAEAAAGPVQWTLGGTLSAEPPVADVVTDATTPSVDAAPADDAVEAQLALADLSAEAAGPSGAVLRQLGVAAQGAGREGTASVALQRTPGGTRLDATGTVPVQVGTDAGEDTVALTLLTTGETALADARFEIASLAAIAPLAGLDWSGIAAGADGRVSATREDGLWTLTLDEVQFADSLVTGRVVGSGQRWQGEVATGVIELPALAPLLVAAGAGPDDGLDAAIDTARLPPIDIVLAVDARAVRVLDGLTVGEAAFNASVSGEGVAVDALTGTLAGGEVTGSASLRETLGDVLVSGRLALTDAEFEVLPGADALPGDVRVTGPIAASGTFEATGGTVRALLRSATGAGEALVVEPVVEGLDPFALARIYERVDASTDAIEPGEVEAAARAALPGGTFAPAALAFDWTLSGGTLRAALAEAEDAGTSVAGTATVDLVTGEADARATVALAVPDDRAAGGAPIVRLRLEGGEGSLDVGSLTGFLNLRAFEIERDRVAGLRAALLEEQRLRRETLLFAARERERQAAIEAERAERERIERERAERERAEREEARRRAAASEAAQAAAARPTAPDAPRLDFDQLSID